MSAKVLRGPNASSPMDIWSGWANVNRPGVALAHEMLVRLEDNDTDAEGIALADYGCLEDWPREGQPFRNFVAEYLRRARAAGPEVEAGFCAALTDLVSLGSQGSYAGADRYENYGEVQP